MILKKFYGKTIKKAREKAFEQLGEGCIVLETRDACEKQEACVTVMANRKKEPVPQNPSPKEQASKNDGTYSRKDLFPKSLNKVKEAVSEGFNRFSDEMGLNGDAPQEDARPSRVQASPPEPKGNSNLTMSRRSTPVYQPAQPQEQPSSNFRQQLSDSMKNEPVSQEVKALHRRFDHMEKLMSDALISANLEYVSHPAFQQLLNTGMQAPTVSRWFEQVLNKGIDPHEQGSEFMSELAGIVRSALSVARPGTPEKNLLFVGPSGSGKTSLIMKLAAHPGFMGEKSVALISVEPEKACKRYTALKPFADDQELPFYTVGTGAEMQSLLPDLEAFDHLFFDTPPLSLQQKSAFRDYWNIRELLSPVPQLEVHYAVNATLERYYFRKSYAANHPLQPDFVAITHLDETDRWGHLIPFINGIGAGVRYVSRGPDVPDQIRRFQPQWFAEQILSTS